MTCVVDLHLPDLALGSVADQTGAGRAMVMSPVSHHLQGYTELQGQIRLVSGSTSVHGMSRLGLG